jgi:hypothetical protein
VEPPAAGRGKWLIAGLVGLLVGAGAVGAAWVITSGRGTEEPEVFTLTGTFQLTDDVISDGSGGCQGSSGYDDITEGTSVTVYDAAGTVVATGSLGESEQTLGVCELGVAVEDVPKGETFYQVEVSHRGKVKLSGEEAESGRFGASLG